MTTNTFCIMTTEYFNTHARIQRATRCTFRKDARTTYTFSRGFGLFVEGYGFLKFKTDETAYILPNKSTLEEIMKAGGLLNLDNIEFVQSI